MRSISRLVLTSALIISAPLGAVACGAALKSVDFPVWENGHSVRVEKGFYDGFGIDGNAADSFAAAQANDLPKAIALIKQGIAQYPKDPFDHYDLGILYEASGDWPSAEAEMKEAVRLEDADAAQGKRKPNKMFAEELAYAERHTPRR